jgi:hypothetical protein
MTHAYGGLVPRKDGEWHHHFEDIFRDPCSICGGRIGTPCRGPRADEWDARMQERLELKERVFHAAYGVSEEGHRYAADEVAKFNAETLRLFPERFREPTPEEQEARDSFDALLRSATGMVVATPLRDAVDRLIAQTEAEEQKERVEMEAVLKGAGAPPRRREKYRFVGASGNLLIWENVRPMPGDSRHEEIRVPRTWFHRESYRRAAEQAQAARRISREPLTDAQYHVMTLHDPHVQALRDQLDQPLSEAEMAQVAENFRETYPALMEWVRKRSEEAQADREARS